MPGGQRARRRAWKSNDAYMPGWYAKGCGRPARVGGSGQENVNVLMPAAASSTATSLAYRRCSAAAAPLNPRSAGLARRSGVWALPLMSCCVSEKPQSKKLCRCKGV